MERRGLYSSEPLAWLNQDGRLLVLNERKPAWAAVNESAAWILRFCAERPLRTREEIWRTYVAEVGPASMQDIETALAGLEAAGLLRNSAEDRGSATGGATPTSTPAYRVEHLYVELLARCNLRCIHCYMAGSPQRRERLDADEVIDLLRQFHDAEGRYVTLSGGEPLLYPEFPRVAAAVAELRLAGTIITNGTVVRDGHLALLDEQGFQVAVSLDGASAQTNDHIRGRGTYAKVVRSLDALLERLGPERVVLSCSPNRVNWHEVPDLIEWARRRGIRRVNLSMIEKAGRGASNWPELALTEHQRTEFIVTVYELALKLVGQLEIDFNDTRNILEVFATDRGPGELHPLWRGVRVDSVGDCYPSTFGSEPRFLLGNIRDIPLGQVLASPVLSQLYELLLDRFQKIPRCSACAWRQLCRGGGVTATYYATGDLLRPDLNCAGYLQAFPRIALALAELEGGPSCAS
jgi:radical SAM protein with 4Fe4S-binding SPASM domain